MEVSTAGPYSLVQRGDSHVFAVEDRRGIGVRPRVVTSFTPDDFAQDQYRVREAEG